MTTIQLGQKDFFMEDTDDPFWIELAQKAGVPIKKRVEVGGGGGARQESSQAAQIYALQQTILELETKMATVVAERNVLKQNVLQEQARGNRYKQFYLELQQQQQQQQMQTKK